MPKVNLVSHFETYETWLWKLHAIWKTLEHFKTLQFVYYSDKTSYLGLHSPTKNLADVPHKYKKASIFISILYIFKCFYCVDVSPN